MGGLAGTGSALAANDPCANLPGSAAASRVLGSFDGAFTTSVLPADGDADFLIPDTLENLKDQPLCAVLAYRTHGQTSKDDVCSSAVKGLTMVLLRSAKQNGKTVATFRVPTSGDGDARGHLRDRACVHVVSFRKVAAEKIFVPDQVVSLEVEVSRKTPAVLAAAILVIVLYVTAALAGSRFGSGVGWWPWQVTAGFHGRASLSRLQLFSFSLIVAALMLYTWIRTGVLVDLSEDLLYLLGISATGTAGAKFTTVVKKRPSVEVRAYLTRKGWFPSEPAKAGDVGRLRDLLLTDGALNVYKFQAAAFSLVVGAAVIGSWFSSGGGFEIPDSLLALMGLSQAFYVGGKAISESDVTKWQDRVGSLEGLEKTYLAAADNAISSGKQRPAANLEFPEAYKAMRALAKTQFDAYYDAATAAREEFRDLYGIKVDDQQVLPMLRS